MNNIDHNEQSEFVMPDDIYNTSTGDIILIGNKVHNKKVHPLEKSNLCNRIFYCWMYGFVFINNKYPWRQEYNYKICDFDDVGKNFSKFKEYFETHGSIYKACWLTVRTEFYIS